MTNVTTLKTAAAPKQTAKQATKYSKKQALRIKQQGAVAVALGLVIATLTGLSLHHQATGVEIITGVGDVEAWSMAIGIDILFIVLELAEITASDVVLKKIGRYLHPTTVGLLAASAVMNAFAFSAQAHSWMMVPAIGLGLAIPALIYSATRVFAAMYMDGHRA